MKKTFKTFALLLLTAFVFSGCVDVPAPFNLPDKSSSTGGDGSSASDEGIAVTCAQAAELVNALADGATSSETYTITGYITQIVGDPSRNQQTFWMADTKDGGKVFEAYYANLPDGVTAFAVGAKVKITGKLMKYVNASNGSVIPEIKNATVVILDDDGGDGGTTVDGTEITCAQAVELTKALADNGTSAETYTVTGYITNVPGEVSKNQQTFWMDDTKGGGKIFEAYYANLPEGVTEFTVGMRVKITGKLTKYVSASSAQTTYEIKNATVVILDDDGSDTPVQQGIPVTCAEAVDIINGMSAGAVSSDVYTVTGYITEIASKVSKNQQIFWMADTKDGGRVLEAYYADLPTGVSTFVVGMKVTLTGKLQKYSGLNGEIVPEIKNGTVVILEDADGGGGETPAGDIIPVTCSEAVQLTMELADNATSTDTYAVTGYITETDGNVSTKTGPRQQVFWMADDMQGGKVFEAYWANVPDGVDAFTVGMRVTITGKLTKYVNASSAQTTCEIKNADVVILEQGDGGGGDDPTPGPGSDPVTDLVNGSFEDWVSSSEALGWKSASSASNATVEMFQGGRGGSFSCLIKANVQTNMRLATQEITLEAGTYIFSYYAKAVTEETSQTRVGYVPVNADGSVGAYKYKSGYIDLNVNDWTLVENEFTLTEQTKLCLIIMNPKSNANSQYTAQDILVDDASLVKQ